MVIRIDELFSRGERRDGGTFLDIRADRDLLEDKTKAAAKPAAGSSCGSGAPGRPGFQPGNQCAKGGKKGTKIADYGDECKPKSVRFDLVDSEGQRHSDVRDDRVSESVRALLGAQIGSGSSEEIGARLASIVGAEDGASVRVIVRQSHVSIIYEEEKTGTEGYRSILLDDDGSLVLSNDEFEVSYTKRGKGTGARMLAREVAHCRKYGIKKIKTHGVGGVDKGKKGYYAWPRMGYDADVHIPRTDRVELGFDEEQPIRMSQLMATKKGRDWWRVNGSSKHYEFDTDPSSISSRILEAYLEEKFGGGSDQKSTKAVKPQGSSCGSGGPGRPGFQPGNQCAKGKKGTKISDYGDDCKPSALTVRGYFDDGEEDDSPVRQESIRTVVRGLLGDEAALGTMDEIGARLASIAGAPDGSDVTVVVEDAGIDIRYQHEELGIETAHRQIRPDPYEGGAKISNEAFFVQPKKQGKRIGAKMLARQVAHARKYGIRRIETWGVGSNHTYNKGYYAWARMGYESEEVDRRYDIPREELGLPPTGSIKISQMMSTKQGRDWWRENGSSLHYTFDTQEGSLSSRVLESYLEEKFGQ